MSDIRMTNHAEFRSKQRGISKKALTLIMAHGIARKAPGDAMKCYLNKQAMDELIHQLKEEIQLIEKLKSVRYIESNDGQIITAYREC